jgi:hypothetical protein
MPPTFSLPLPPGAAENCEQQKNLQVALDECLRPPAIGTGNATGALPVPPGAEAHDPDLHADKAALFVTSLMTLDAGVWCASPHLALVLGHGKGGEMVCVSF